jgi:hypothetical protein
MAIAAFYTGVPAEFIEAGFVSRRQEGRGRTVWEKARPAAKSHSDSVIPALYRPGPKSSNSA